MDSNENRPPGSVSDSGIEDEKTIVIDRSIPSESSNSGIKIGRFDFVSPLGEGGMGEVFLCRDPQVPVGEPRNLVAVKVVSAEMMKDAEALRRFEAEAKILAPIRHGNVVRLIEWGKLEGGAHSGSHFIAMEYIKGTSLHVLGRRRRISFPDVIRIGIQIAKGPEGHTFRKCHPSRPQTRKHHDQSRWNRENHRLRNRKTSELARPRSPGTR